MNRQLYIFLEDGDVIQEGDEWVDMCMQWHETPEAGTVFVNDEDNPTFYRRKVSKEVVR